MNLTVTIAGNNRTSRIDWKSFRITDKINSASNICQFSVKVYGASPWKPAVGDSIVVTDSSVKIFAGSIIRINKVLNAARIESYEVDAVDYTFDLNKLNVVESYTSQTVENIIADVLSSYLTGFTDNHVSCPTLVTSIKFDHLSVAKCLDKLAKLVGYNWYVDYDKDIHFFAANDEGAPYSLTDTSGNYIFESLQLADDLSQVRNLVRVRGGTIVGTSRTETQNGDGTKKTFPLSNKFSEKPTVTVGGVGKTVGLDYIDADTSFDCMWNFNEKYIRFISAPASGTNNISVASTPLIPIIVQVQADDSIAAHGQADFYAKDTTIKSKNEAKDFAIAQLQAYKNSVAEGSFETEVSGLSSGQTISIGSVIRGFDPENYVIQSVSLMMRGHNLGRWKVELATLRTVGIIRLLQDQLLNKIGTTQEAGDEVIDKFYTDNAEVEVSEQITLIEVDTVDEKDIEITEQIRKDPWLPEFVLAPYTVIDDIDNKREMLIDISSYVY